MHERPQIGIRFGALLKRRAERGSCEDPLLSVTQNRGVIPQGDAGRRNISSLDKTTYWRVYPDDLVYNTMRMWQGASARSEYFGIVSPAYTVCSPVEGTSPRFLSYALKLPEHVALFSARSQGITSDVWNLRFQEFARIQIKYLPDYAQQERIAEILSTVDEAIEQTEALVAKTHQIKAGLMHDLFTRGVTADGQLRPPRKEAPHLYKQSPLGWIPDDWETGHLADRRAENRSHIKTGPFGSSLKLEHWADDGVPVITIGALGEGEFIHSQLLHVSEETADRLIEYRLSEGDIVFSRVADVGRSAVITAAERGWIMSSNLMRISLDRARAVPKFVQSLLAFDSRVRAQIRSTVNSGGRDVANSAILNRINFCWPEFAEQERIVESLNVLDTRQHHTLESLNKLCRLKGGLMQDLLTGRVPVTTDTPAEVVDIAANA